jgi:copper chaperone
MLLAAVCYPFKKSTSIKGEDDMTTIKINGMSCNHCVMAVTKALRDIDGIRNVKVDLEKGEAAFDEDETIDMEIIKERIRKAGYEVD